MAVAPESVLTQSLLDRCRERAPLYDRENRFCQEDFDELKAAGYLLMTVPRELGGLGMNLAQVAARRASWRRTRRPPRSASTCTITGSGSPPTCGAPATNRASGCCAKRRRAKCSPRATPNMATTCR